MLKHIIFDFDGTIADSRMIGLQIVNDLAKKYHYQKFSMAELQTFSNIPIKERLKKIGVPLYKLPQIMIDGLVQYKCHMHSLQAYDGIRETLDGLKGEGMYVSIISSNSAEIIKQFLQKNDLDVFDNIFSVKNLFGKHRSIIKYLKEFGLAVDEVIYVGDELRDIEASKKVGVRIIAVVWGFDAPELLQIGNADYLADEPSDIFRIVKEIKSRRSS